LVVNNILYTFVKTINEMDAKEFRVGNHVKDVMAESYGLDPICVVSAIFSNREHPFNTCKKVVYPCLGSVSEMILGIPLTEEWLLKFGFTFRKDTGFIGWYSQPVFGESIRVFLIENGYFKFHSATTVIKYVHQLQNLYFALTNEELTIN
jgi:hypothetical protein